jgi:tripartite-type tricarboxylate transporter receptor subunit TctC
MALSLSLRRRSMCLLACLTTATGFAHAQGEYPTMPIHVIVPYPAGGSLDTVIRPLSEQFEKATGQNMVMENIGGAGGLVAAGRVVKSKPDGYTLLLASNGQVSLAPLLYPTMSYDPQKDLAPIILLVDQPAVLYASAKSIYKSLADVLAAARADKNGLNFASSGTGSVSHLAMELLAQSAGVRFNHVPYKGAVPALQDLAGGQVPLLFTFVGSAKPLTDSGLVRPLAVASDKRLAALPDVPTFNELGMPGMLASVWIGLMGPRDMPAAAVRRVAEVSDAIIQQADFQQKMAANSTEVKGGTAAAFKAVIDADTFKWNKLAKSVKLAGE